ncbi:unnamed protein product [Vitrella brassicaformis CCMP3155]|uniref:VWFA domain-containing protein n=1 Tax=Vitrella brassicaformis (strain CCMP3155) TaxID=1169540 RepID=A0A0G4EZY3_VITBC|nr:unnamed protein product [Vitrella brassicaformis CCMP3155]|eukprot:CEM04780.1 unnamed protein product [Vitrella brassicaformis CCMP3155]
MLAAGCFVVLAALLLHRGTCATIRARLSVRQRRAVSMPVAEAMMHVQHILPTDVQQLFLHDNRKLNHHGERTLAVIDQMNGLARNIQEELDATKLQCDQSLLVLDDAVRQLGEDQGRLETDLGYEQSGLTEWESRKDSAATVLSKTLLDEHNAFCQHEASGIRAKLASANSDFRVSQSVIGHTNCRHNNSGNNNTATANAVLLEAYMDSCLSGTHNQPSHHVLSGLSEGRERQLWTSLMQAAAHRPRGEATTPMRDESIPTSKCSVGGSALCPVLLNSFAVLIGETYRDIRRLNRRLEQLSSECDSGRQRFNQNIAGLQRAIDTANAQVASHDARIERLRTDLRLARRTATQKAAERAEKAEECREAQEKAETSMCGMIKIRGEIAIMANTTELIQDCEVSNWQYGECSASCGDHGGLQNITRSVVSEATPKLGTPCPPLNAVMVCSRRPCPVDCQMDGWSEWTRCSADCGYGTKYSYRNVLVEARHGGAACGARQQSTACGGGVRSRRRDVLVEAKGRGTCPGKDSTHRYEEIPCNAHPCPPHPVCQSKADIVLVLDGSGTVLLEHFDSIKDLAKSLVRQTALNATAGHAQVGVVVFSHEATVASRLTDDRTSLIGAIDHTQWAGREAATADALIKAEQVLQNGVSEPRELGESTIVHLRHTSIT